MLGNSIKLLSPFFLFTVLFTQAVYSTEESGYQTAANLNRNYENIVEDCGSPTRPAFLCSGVLLRATNPNTEYFAWDPSPKSVASGGVSFSYLRKDAKFTKLAYGYLNGMILYPYAHAPEYKNTDLDVMCAFPIDAGTNERTNAGCGAHWAYPDTSISCQEQGVFTSKTWIAHYDDVDVGGNKNAHQCGFTTSEASGEDPTTMFNQAILSQSELPDGSFRTQNELRIATWDTKDQNYPENFPIQAFFYIYKQSGSNTPIEKGLVGAQESQETYYQVTRIWVPIVRMTLPLTTKDDAHFEYSKDDQKIPEPDI